MDTNEVLWIWEQLFQAISCMIKSLIYAHIYMEALLFSGKCTELAVALSQCCWLRWIVRKKWTNPLQVTQTNSAFLSMKNKSILGETLMTCPPPTSTELMLRGIFIGLGGWQFIGIGWWHMTTVIMCLPHVAAGLKDCLVECVLCPTVSFPPMRTYCCQQHSILWGIFYRGILTILRLLLRRWFHFQCIFDCKEWGSTAWSAALPIHLVKMSTHSLSLWVIFLRWGGRSVFPKQLVNVEARILIRRETEKRRGTNRGCVCFDDWPVLFFRTA